MRRLAWLTRLALVAALPVAFALTACKQGKGERCQIDSDCADGLVCTGQFVCDTTKTGGLADAGPAPDARPDATTIDATTIDAPPGTPDASVDATPASDAAVDAL
jgi:hypothetical protein